MSNDLKIGDILDSRYQLQEFLGGGRVGRVYLVKDLEENRQVAAKILASKFHSDREKNLFAREFAAVKPGIVTVYDIGQINGLPYFTMEYVEGKRLMFT